MPPPRAHSSRGLPNFSGWEPVSWKDGMLSVLRVLTFVLKTRSSVVRTREGIHRFLLLLAVLDGRCWWLSF